MPLRDNLIESTQSHMVHLHEGLSYPLARSLPNILLACPLPIVRSMIGCCTTVDWHKGVSSFAFAHSKNSNLRLCLYFD